MRQGRGQAQRRLEVGEGLVDDEQAVARRELVGERDQTLRRDPTPIGVVRVAQHDAGGIFHRGKIVDLRDPGPGAAPGRAMFGVGRPKNGHVAMRQQKGEQADQNLRAGRGDDHGRVGGAEAERGCALQFEDRLGFG